MAAIGGLIVVGVIVALAGGGDDDDDTTADATVTTEAPAEAEAPAAPGVAGEPDEVDDVTLDSCENTAGIDLAVARGSITNDSSESSSYLIEFSVLDASGTVVGSGIGAVNDVQPGTQVVWEGQSGVGLPDGGTCQLASVERLAS